MKKSILLFTFMLIALISNAQEFSFNLYLEDGQGNRDTLVFGYDSTATDSIDVNFDEIDILGQPWDSVFEARTVNVENLNFPYEFNPRYQSKKQIIYYKHNSPYSTNFAFSNHIGVLVKSINEPISITWDSALFADSCIVSSAVFLYHYVCGGPQWASDVDSLVLDRNYIYPNYYIENQDTLWFFSFAFRSYNTIDINNIAQTKNILDVYPNPTKDKLVINIPNEYRIRNSQIIIYNSVGNEVEIIIVPNNTEYINLNINSLSSGIYFIRIKSDGVVGGSGSFIKQ